MGEVSFAAALRERYRRLGPGGLVCLVLYYLAQLLLLALTLQALPLLGLLTLASICTLWLLNRLAYVLGLVVAVINGLMWGGFAALSVFFTVVSWAVDDTLGELFTMFSSLVVVAFLFLFGCAAFGFLFLLVKRRAFGIGLPPQPAPARREDPWD